MATFSSQAVKACRLRPKSLSTHILTLFAENMKVHRKFPCQRWALCRVCIAGAGSAAFSAFPSKSKREKHATGLNAACPFACVQTFWWVPKQSALDKTFSVLDQGVNFGVKTQKVSMIRHINLHLQKCIHVY